MNVCYFLINKEILKGDTYVAAKVGADTDLVAVVVDRDSKRIVPPTPENVRAADADLKGAGYSLAPLEEVCGAGKERSGLMILRLNAGDAIGSAVLLRRDALNVAYSRLGRFYILPSSVHEVLCISVDNGVNAQELLAVVQNVNDEYVSPAEQLSNHVYMYDGAEIRIAA